MTAATNDLVALSYTVTNLGTATASGAVFNLTLPAGTSVLESSPSGSVVGGVLEIPMPDVLPGAPSAITVSIATPSAPVAMAVAADLVFASDPVGYNNTHYAVVAVLENAVLPAATLTLDPLDDTLHFSFPTLDGANYRFERSPDLDLWTMIEDFTGDGFPYEPTPIPTTEDHEFFRFRVIP